MIIDISNRHRLSASADSANSYRDEASIELFWWTGQIRFFRGDCSAAKIYIDLPVRWASRSMWVIIANSRRVRVKPAFIRSKVLKLSNVSVGFWRIFKQFWANGAVCASWKLKKAAETWWKPWITASFIVPSELVWYSVGTRSWLMPAEFRTAWTCRVVAKRRYCLENPEIVLRGARKKCS